MASAVVAAMIVAASVGVAAPAASATGEDTDQPRREQAMQFAGFDERVAAANGYEIRTNELGERVSVPVTPEAVAFDASLDAAPTAYKTIVEALR